MNKRVKNLVFMFNNFSEYLFVSLLSDLLLLLYYYLGFKAA